jgi:hypothetical protein
MFLRVIQTRAVAVELVDTLVDSGVSEQGRNYATDQVPTAAAPADHTWDHVVEPAAAEPAAAELVNTLVDSGRHYDTDQVPTAAATSDNAGDHVVAEPAAAELVNTLVSEQGRNCATDQVPTAAATSDHAGVHVAAEPAAAEPAAAVVEALVNTLINRYRSDIEYLQGIKYGQQLDGAGPPLVTLQHGKVTQQHPAVEVGIQEEEQDGAVTALDMLLRDKMKSKVDYTHDAAIDKLTGGLNTIGELMSNVGKRCQMVLDLVDDLLCEAAIARQPKLFLQNLPDKMSGIRESLIEMRQSVESSPDQPGPSTVGGGPSFVGPQNAGGPSGKRRRLLSSEIETPDDNVKAKKHKASAKAKSVVKASAKDGTVVKKASASGKAKNDTIRASTTTTMKNNKVVKKNTDSVRYDSDGDPIYSCEDV